MPDLSIRSRSEPKQCDSRVFASNHLTLGPLEVRALASRTNSIYTSSKARVQNCCLHPLDVEMTCQFIILKKGPGNLYLLVKVNSFFTCSLFIEEKTNTCVSFRASTKDWVDLLQGRENSDCN